MILEIRKAYWVFEEKNCEIGREYLQGRSSWTLMNLLYKKNLKQFTDAINRIYQEV